MSETCTPTRAPVWVQAALPCWSRNQKDWCVHRSWSAVSDVVFFTRLASRILDSVAHADSKNQILFDLGGGVQLQILPSDSATWAAGLFSPCVLVVVLAGCCCCCCCCCCCLCHSHCSHLQPHQPVWPCCWCHNLAWDKNLEPEVGGVPRLPSPLHPSQTVNAMNGTNQSDCTFPVPPLQKTYHLIPYLDINYTESTCHMKLNSYEIYYIGQNAIFKSQKWGFFWKSEKRFIFPWDIKHLCCNARNIFLNYALIRLCDAVG